MSLSQKQDKCYYPQQNAWCTCRVALDKWQVVVMVSVERIIFVKGIVCWLLFHAETDVSFSINLLTGFRETLSGVRRSGVCNVLSKPGVVAFSGEILLSD